MVFSVTFSSLACDHNTIDVAMGPAFETKQLWKIMIDIISLFSFYGVSVDLSVSSYWDHGGHVGLSNKIGSKSFMGRGRGGDTVLPRKLSFTGMLT